MRPLVRQFWSDLTYQVVTLPASILAFTVVVAGLSVAAAALGIIIGLPLLLVIFAVLRWNARIERKRTGWALGEPVLEAYRRREGNWLRRLRIVAGDPQSWKDLAWLTFVGTLGFCVAVTAITIWATIAGLLVLPAWYWSLPNEGVDFGLFRADTLGEAFLGVDLGLVAIPVAYLLTRWTTEGMLRLSRALLSPSREAALEARVGELAATRAGAVDAAAAELQRIERDLHDGAQARLVALALDLGLAEERFARDPEGARALVGEAREEAKRALAELRDLARGIRPSLLSERGLGPALTALAARSAIPASVDLAVPEGLSHSVENTTWFVVSEALANAAKHSKAQRVLVSVGRAGDRLVVEIVDDGVGGASGDGSGLRGLRQRVEALDGRLDVISPAGGPTTIRAELPCAS
ncbi:MAG TPA: sensor domain-containing protein [Solirubrobacteraceae bacterium]|nr:sensor domain-containing protein [Solirubrobacteraceae bacterium]